MSIDYSERIPNNVNLASNKTLQRALEHAYQAQLSARLVGTPARPPATGSISTLRFFC